VLCPSVIKTNIVDSDRHRPGRLTTEFTEDQKFVTDYLAGAVEKGMDPEEVAGMVVAAIRAEQFLILTHDAYPPALGARAEALLDRRLPDIPDFA
jgi:hypothetical protein